MSCRKFRKWLFKDLGTLVPHQREQLIEHLRMCQKCQLASQSLKRLTNTMQTISNKNAPPKIGDQIWKDVREQIKKKSISINSTSIVHPHHRPQLITWGVPSFALACLIIWLFLSRPWKGPSQKSIRLQETSSIFLEYAEVDGRDAKVMTFQFKDPSFSVIWIE